MSTSVTSWLPRIRIRRPGRPQADLLHADAAGSHQAQGTHVDRLHVCGTAGRPACPAGDQLGADALGFLLDAGRTIDEHWRLAVQDVLDARAQPRPFCVGDVEVAAEVEEGALADGFSDALGVNEPMGEVGLSGLGAASLGAPDEHGVTIRGRGTYFNPENKIMALHLISQDSDSLESTTYRQALLKIRPKSAKWRVKLLNLG